MIAGCAGQIEPGGGPIDREPPTVVATVPDSGAVRITEPAVELEFSKYVDRLTVQQSIFISPDVGPLEYDWSGTSVRIAFRDSLRPNRTYVVNVGTDVADVHARNKMAKGFSLAFSTGDSLDRGSISGRVFNDKPDGVMLFAYQLHGASGDTLNPTHTPPEYIQQTGKGGDYELSHLAWGTYRIIAVRDEYKNKFYDRQVDAYGTWRSDVMVNGDLPSQQHVDFRLAVEDTSRPFVSSVRAIDRTRLQIRLSEPIDTARFSDAVFHIVDTTMGRPCRLRYSYLDYAHPSTIGIVMDSSLDSSHIYTVIASGIADAAGNPLDSAVSATSSLFVGSPVPDTVLPRLMPVFRDSTRGVAPDAPITLMFSEPVDTTALCQGIALFDSLHAKLGVALRWRGGLSLALSPVKGFRPSGWYELQIRIDSLRDFSGNARKDSLLRLRFRTGDIKALGTIEGTVTANDTVRGKVTVIATGADRGAVVKKRVTIPKAGPFILDKVPEGRYAVQAFLDPDSTGVCDAGRVFPFRTSAPFGVYADTVKVRARWGVQGVRIDLK